MLSEEKSLILSIFYKAFLLFQETLVYLQLSQLLFFFFSSQTYSTRLVFSLLLSSISRPFSLFSPYRSALDPCHPSLGDYSHSVQYQFFNRHIYLLNVLTLTHELINTTLVTVLNDLTKFLFPTPENSVSCFFFPLCNTFFSSVTPRRIFWNMSLHVTSGPS